MASIIELRGTEQAFTSANTFSGANSTVDAGWNIVRVINTGTVAAIITVNNTVSSNITLMPSAEIIIKKAANTTMAASNASILGVLIAFENN